MADEGNGQFHFAGFSVPSYTMIPDEFFDEIVPHISEAELRVLLYIFRRTFGFKKESDTISLTQLVEGIRTADGRVLDKGTGMARSACARGVKGLAEKGIITSQRNQSAAKGNLPTTYALRFRVTPYTSKETTLVLKEDYPLVLLEDPQKRGNPRDSNTRPSNTSKEPIVDNLWITSAERATPDPAIANLITDLSRQFGDMPHVQANITRAQRMCGEMNLDLDLFFEHVYAARAKTYQRAGVENRMAYFFAVLGDALAGSAPHRAAQPGETP